MLMPQMIPSWYWLLAAGCFGALAGSFINMAAYRLPRGISTVTRARSFCPACQHQLAWYENIPILSFLGLRGHCLHCKARIPIRYLLVELIVTALFIAAAYQFFLLNHAVEMYQAPAAPARSFQFWRLLALFGVQLFLIVDLVLLSVVDIETWTIPNVTTFAGTVLGFLLALVLPELHASATVWTGSRAGDALLDSFMGFVLGAGLLWSVGFLTTVFTFVYFRYRGWNDRPKEGMGMGDVQLLGMVGALLGWKAVLCTLLLGVFIGSITGVLKITWEKLQRRRLGSAYKPWQPTYEVQEDAEGGGPPAPRVGLLLLNGVIILVAVGFLYDQAAVFTGRMSPTLEEALLMPLVSPAEATMRFDVRLLPLGVMFLVGWALVASAGFFSYLKRVDKLPQGNIVENESGTKEEVLQGNYVPFGPSLALAAIIVSFYDPVLRDGFHWFVMGAIGPMPPPTFNVLGERAVLDAITYVGTTFNRLTGQGLSR